MGLCIGNEYVWRGMEISLMTKLVRFLLLHMHSSTSTVESVYFLSVLMWESVSLVSPTVLK